MRQLTDSEQEALKRARIVWLGQLTIVNRSISESHKAGFIAALDYNAEQVAALTAECDAYILSLEGLRAALQQIAAGIPQGGPIGPTQAKSHPEPRLERCPEVSPELVEGLVEGLVERLVEGRSPASPGKWLTDIEMAEIARGALGEGSGE